MIAAKMVIGAIAGVDRPALAAVFPNARGRTCCPRRRRQRRHQARAPAAVRRDGSLLRPGSPRHRRAAHRPAVDRRGGGQGHRRDARSLRVLKTTGLNFIGNVEGRDVFNGDGRRRGLRRLRRQRGAEGGRVDGDSDGRHVARGAPERCARRLGRLCDGQAGVRCLPAHGWTTPNTARRRCSACAAAASSATAGPMPRAIKNAVRRAVEFCAADLHTKIHDKVEELHAARGARSRRAEVGSER